MFFKTKSRMDESLIVKWKICLPALFLPLDDTWNTKASHWQIEMIRPLKTTEIVSIGIIRYSFYFYNYSLGLYSFKNNTKSSICYMEQKIKSFHFPSFCLEQEKLLDNFSTCESLRLLQLNFKLRIANLLFWLQIFWLHNFISNGCLYLKNLECCIGRF